MHSLKGLAQGPGSHVLPGILLLILGAAVLCIWEMRRLTGRQTGCGRDRLIALSGIVLTAASCVLMAARFIWVA
jgi:hypothetical protein